MAAEVLIEMRSKFRGNYPEMPISETAIKQFEDDNPVFLTLPIGKVGTTSRNGRYYDREAMQMIVDTINQETVIGQLGHLKEEERPYRFDVPPVIWMSATMETDGTVWAKGYVMKHAAPVREYVKISKAQQARVATSIYGMAEVDEKGKVRNLQIESIDFAHPSRVGVLLAASVPAITAETEQAGESSMSQVNNQEGESARLNSEAATEATSRTTSESSANPTPEVIAEAVKSLKVGDWVGWEKEGRLVRGKVNTIWTEGDVEVLGADELLITATAENPVARMDVYEPSYHQTGKWQANWQQVVHYFSSLTAIEPLSESQIIRKANQENNDMATLQEMETENTSLRQQLAETKRQNTEEVRRLKAQIAESDGQNADLKSISELLSNPQDVVVAVQALQADNKSLRRENGDLLQESIKLQVAEKVKVEAVRPVIEQMVRERKPVRRAEVTANLDNILQLDYVKTLLRSEVQETMGPAHQRPAATPQTANEEEQFFVFPEGK
jgi:hypothetical protein